MSVRDLFPSNDLLGSAPIFDSHMLTTSVALADNLRYHAQLITHHRAPDLYEMLFATDERPAMNGVAA